MFAPIPIFLLLWSVQLAGHVIWEQDFDPILNETWITVVSATISFCVGAYFAGQFALPEYQAKSGGVNKGAIKVFLVGFPLIIIGIVFWMAHTFGSFSLPEIRTAIIAAKLAGDGNFDIAIKVLILGVAFSLYFLCVAEQLNTATIVSLVAIGLVSAILTTGRLQLLMFFVASCAILRKQGLLRPIHVVGVAITFIALFLLIAVVLGKGEEAGGGWDQLTWNLNVYILGGVSCFNNFIETGNQSIEGGALLPNFLRPFFNLMERPPLNPFAQVPYDCNTYTGLYPLYHDFGLAGAAIGFACLGAFHQRLYMRYATWDSKTYIYLYSLSLYPLTMSIFEDAYFTSLGIWAIFWIPIIFFSISEKVFRTEVSDGDVVIESNLPSKNVIS